jgi:predicted lipoprotein
MRIVLALLFALIAGPAMAQLSTSPGEVMRGAVNNFIRPAMTDLGAKADALSTAVAQLCTTPSQANLSTVDTAFGDTAIAIGRIEAIRVGPIMEENRSERLLFWPDRKGIALKQVQAILSSKDESATAPDTLRSKSVAVQGLTALEFVLYGTGFETLQTTDGAFRCRYGSAIAQSVAAVAGELVTAWTAEDGIALHLMKPDAAFTDYRTPIEAQEELVGILSHGIEAVRDTRLNPFLAKGDVAAKPKLALFWRSGLTVPMIRANVEGLQSLFALSGISGGVPDDRADLPVSISVDFAKADAALDLVTDPAQVQALADVVTATQQLGVLIGEQLSSALGLSVGFSSLDGD